MRLFIYSREFDKDNNRNCTAGTTDVIARYYGEKVYSETIRRCTCPRLYEDDPPCEECCKPNIVTD